MKGHVLLGFAFIPKKGVIITKTRNKIQIKENVLLEFFTYAVMERVNLKPAMVSLCN